MAAPIMHYVVDAFDRTSVCGRQSLRTTDEAQVTCVICNREISRWEREAEAEAKAMAEVEAEANHMAVGFGLRTWD